MVADYFMLAAFAVRRPVTVKPETFLVFVAFVLYSCWDEASVCQKWGGDDNRYRVAWNKARQDPARPDVPKDKEWPPTEWGRVWATRAALVAAAVVWACTWFVAKRPTPGVSIFIDCLLLVILIVYRLLKERWAGRTFPTW